MSMVSRAGLVAAPSSSSAGASRRARPPVSRPPGRRCTSCGTTRGSARPLCAAATGSRSRTALARAASTTCDVPAATSPKRSSPAPVGARELPEEALVRGAIAGGARRASASSSFPPCTHRRAGGAQRWLLPCHGHGDPVRACTLLLVSRGPGQRAYRHHGLEPRPRSAHRRPRRRSARAPGRCETKNGLYARGRFAPTPDGGRVFRALRLYLRAMPPRA